MGVYTAGTQLTKAAKQLEERWREAQMAWDDPVSRRFEEQYLQPLYADLKTALSAMGQMAALLERIRRDCS